MATLADYMAQAFKSEGVKRIFGYPGGATLDVMEAAQKQGIDFILPRSEWSAAYMANMTGELTGVPGIVLSTLGPGATNLVNGVAQAYLDRTPLIAITGRHGLKAGNANHQLLNQVSIFEPVTKWSTTLTADSGASLIRRAFRIARADRPGPVHLDLPTDQGRRECEDEVSGPIASIGVTYGEIDPAPIVQRLSKSKRPILLVGPEALRQNASVSLTKFAENWGIPVVTSVKAKGVIDERNPYSVGTVDMAGAKAMKEFIKSSDLILAIGFDTVELIGKWGVNVPTIHIDIVSNTDYVYFADSEYIGDISKVLSALANESITVPKWSEKEISDFKSSYMAKLTPDFSTDNGLVPSRVIQTAREVLPDDTIVVTDTGSHKMSMGTFWKAFSPKTYFVSNGLGTMGYGIPAAIAAKLHSPDNPVVCFTGDGGFAMVSSELGTAVQLNCPIIVIVFSDGKLDRILRKQETANLERIGTNLMNPDFTKLAESYGAIGEKVTNYEELSQAISKALSQNVPTLIEVPIDAAEYAHQFKL